MERRRISICIPTYQRPEILRRTLAHLAEIDRLDMEVVVSDNASGDGTEEAVRSFEGHFPALRYHCQSENRDAPDNIETALSMATRAYSDLLGDDDQIIVGCISAAI